MREKVCKKLGRIADVTTTLSCSLALSVYIIYYSMFKYKGNPTEDKKGHRK